MDHFPKSAYRLLSHKINLEQFPSQVYLHFHFCDTTHKFQIYTCHTSAALQEEPSYEDRDTPITAEEPKKAESDQGPSVQPHKQADQTRRGKNVLQQKTCLVD